MCIIKYDSGDEFRYFASNKQFYDYIHSTLPMYIMEEPFAQWLSRLSAKEILNLSGRVYALFGDDILDLPADELLVFDYELDDEWRCLLCPQEVFATDAVCVINRVSEFYDLDFKATMINTLIIAVADSDNLCLQNEYPSPGVTLWDNVDDFISDTQYHVEYYHGDECIETYEDAVSYWEENQYWRVISNYSLPDDKRAD
ncbi:MAG: hypothetical protein E7202_08925 [Selenomonas ruminantium]|nr:hypothetical protein [Selenomonas ruminantium]